MHAQVLSQPNERAAARARSILLLSIQCRHRTCTTLACGQQSAYGTTQSARTFGQCGAGNSSPSQHVCVILGGGLVFLGQAGGRVSYLPAALRAGRDPRLFSCTPASSCRPASALLRLRGRRAAAAAASCSLLGTDTLPTSCCNRDLRKQGQQEAGRPRTVQLWQSGVSHAVWASVALCIMHAYCQRRVWRQ